MVFLILFLSFSLKNDAFLIGFKSFLILFSYSFYAILLLSHALWLYLFPDSRPDFMIIPSSYVCLLSNFLVVYCFPVYQCTLYPLCFILNHCRVLL